MSNQKPLAIGIDLGTTYSCVAVMRDGRPEVIPNDMGERTTRSIVAFVDGERIVGTLANNYLSSDPETTIYGAKRLIGKTIDDPSILEDLKQWPFKVVSEEIEGQQIPRIEIVDGDNTRSFAPEQISAMVLENIRKSSSQFLGYEVKQAVITVPAYFNDSQRKATVLAGKLAGLEVLQILNEPTAAALAYGLEKLADSKKFVNILVFDFGGGTLDVTFMRCMDGAFTVISTAGDTHLGGEDLDMRMVDYCISTWTNTQINKESIEITSNMRSQVRVACELAKRALSRTKNATVTVNNFWHGKNLRVDISLVKFEELAKDLFAKCMLQVDRVIEDSIKKDSKLNRDSIEHVVLVGGSSRIPRIRKLLDDYFPRQNGSILCHEVNPDEVVAQGAAIQAAVLSGSTDARLQDIVLVDVAPLSLGVEAAGGLMSVIIARNSTIPAKGTKVYSTNEDNQTAVTIQAYEGLRTETINCRKLGQFELKGIPAAKKGLPRIEVTFSLDTNGILTISAKDTTTGKSKIMPINRTAGQLNDSQVQKMVDEAERYRAQDELIAQRADIVNKFETYIGGLKDSWRNTNATDEIKADGISRIDAADNWLDINRRLLPINDIQAYQIELSKWFAQHLITNTNASKE
jgi:L1 cell adhesion molecule like protein